MKPKLLYLITSLNIGGTEKFLVQLVDHLHDEYDITVCYMKDKGALGESLAQKGIPVVSYPGFTGLVKFMKQERFQLLHTFLYRANITGRIAGKIAGVPITVSTRQAIDLWRRPYQVWLDLATERFSDLIIANSQATRDVLIKKERVRPDKIEVVYNGVPPSISVKGRDRHAVRAALSIPDDAKVVISVTRLHYDKGTDYLAAIFKDVTEEAWFLIVGDGPERTRLAEQVQTMGLTDRTIITGWRNDIGDMLRTADVFLLPSREESFPQAVLEAMACGLPVVAADVGGVQELVKQGTTGILVRPGDTAGFSRALNELLSDRDRLQRTGDRGREKSSQFSEALMIERMRLIYRHTLQKTGCCS
jgi:glycosyltransferase involved in cell wall biosynthesis